MQKVSVTAGAFLISHILQIGLFHCVSCLQELWSVLFESLIFQTQRSVWMFCLRITHLIFSSNDRWHVCSWTSNQIGPWRGRPLMYGKDRKCMRLSFADLWNEIINSLLAKQFLLLLVIILLVWWLCFAASGTVNRSLKCCCRCCRRYNMRESI